MIYFLNVNILTCLKDVRPRLHVLRNHLGKVTQVQTKCLQEFLDVEWHSIGLFTPLLTGVIFILNPAFTPFKLTFHSCHFQSRVCSTTFAALTLHYGVKCVQCESNRDRIKGQDASRRTPNQNWTVLASFHKLCTVKETPCVHCAF